MFLLVILMFHYLFCSLPTDVMITVFKVGARTEKGWSFLLSMYSSMDCEAEKNKILEALASSEDVQKLYWYGTIQRTWYKETKIKAHCSLGQEPIFSWVLTSSLTWLGQGCEEFAWTRLHLGERTLTDGAEYTLFKRLGDINTHNLICVLLGNVVLPWHDVLNMLVLYINLFMLSLWECKHFRKREL